MGLGAALLLAAGAAGTCVFGVRGVGAAILPAPPAAARRPDRPPPPALTWPVARLLHRGRGPIVLWSAINAFLGAGMVSLARSVAGLTGASPQLTALFDHATGGLELGFVALLWAGTAQLVLAGCAAQTVAGWTVDDTGGVLAALLGRPTSRAGLVLERGAAAAVALAIVAAPGTLGAGLAAATSGLVLPSGRLVTAGALFVPFGLFFAAAGAGVGGRWPRGAAIALGIVAILSFLDADVAAIVGLPAWAGDLSVFRPYGNPLVSPPYWIWAMLTITALGFGVGAVGMGRRDVA